MRDFRSFRMVRVEVLSFGHHILTHWIVLARETASAVPLQILWWSVSSCQSFRMTTLWMTICTMESTLSAIALVAYILFISMNGWTAIDIQSFTSLVTGLPRPCGWLETDFITNTLLWRLKKLASPPSTTSLTFSNISLKSNPTIQAVFTVLHLFSWGTSG